MFELTYSQLRDRGFQAAMGKIVNAGGFKIKDAYNISRLSDFMGQEVKRSDKLFREVVEQFTPVEQDGTYEVPEDKREEFAAAAEEFMAHKVAFERHKIKLTTLSDNPKCAITPNDLCSLEPILEDDLDGTDNNDSAENS